MTKVNRACTADETSNREMRDAAGAAPTSDRPAAHAWSMTCR